MLPCGLRRDELIAYTDDELPAKERARVAAHVHACAACQERIDAYAEVDQLLRRHIRPVDDPAARAALLERLTAMRDQPTPKRYGHYAIALALVCVLLVGLAVFVLGYLR